MLPRYFFYLLTYVSLSFPTQGFGQQETQHLNDDGQDRGAIILVSVEGSVFVLKNDSGRQVPTTKVVTGRVNFIQNVYYNVNHLDSEANFDSLAPLPNGKHPIVIKKR